MPILTLAWGIATYVVKVKHVMHSIVQKTISVSFLKYYHGETGNLLHKNMKRLLPKYSFNLWKLSVLLFMIINTDYVLEKNLSL